MFPPQETPGATTRTKVRVICITAVTDLNTSGAVVRLPEAVRGVFLARHGQLLKSRTQQKPNRLY